MNVEPIGRTQETNKIDGTCSGKTRENMKWEERPHMPLQAGVQSMKYDAKIINNEMKNEPRGDITQV